LRSSPMLVKKNVELWREKEKVAIWTSSSRKGRNLICRQGQAKKRGENSSTAVERGESSQEGKKNLPTKRRSSTLNRRQRKKKKGPQKGKGKKKGFARKNLGRGKGNEASSLCAFEKEIPSLADKKDQSSTEGAQKAKSVELSLALSKKERAMIQRGQGPFFISGRSGKKGDLLEKKDSLTMRPVPVGKLVPRPAKKKKHNRKKRRKGENLQSPSKGGEVKQLLKEVNPLAREERRMHKREILTLLGEGNSRATPHS